MHIIWMPHFSIPLLAPSILALAAAGAFCFRHISTEFYSANFPVAYFNYFVNFLINSSHSKMSPSNGSFPSPQFPPIGFNSQFEQFYLLGLDIGVWLAILVHLLFLWMAFFNTPKEMFNYRITVSNTTIWSFLQLIVYGIFIRPVPLFPLPAAKMTGPFSLLGDFYGAQLGFILAILCTTNYVTAACICFLVICVFLLEPQWRLIQWISRPIGLFIGICAHLTTTLCVAFLMFFVFPPAHNLKDKFLKQYSPAAIFGISPHSSKAIILFGYNPAADEGDGRPKFMAILIFSLLITILTIVGLLYLMLVHTILTNLRKDNWSETVRMRRNVVIMLTARILSPTLFGFVPTIILCLIVHFGVGQTFELNCILCGAAITHGFQQSVATLAAYRPYREAIWKKIQLLLVKVGLISPKAILQSQTAVRAIGGAKTTQIMMDRRSYLGPQFKSMQY